MMAEEVGDGAAQYFGVAEGRAHEVVEGTVVEHKARTAVEMA